MPPQVVMFPVTDPFAPLCLPWQSLRLSVLTAFAAQNCVTDCSADVLGFVSITCMTAEWLRPHKSSLHARFPQTAPSDSSIWSEKQK